MSRWGIAVCIVLAALAEGVALQWPAYALIAGHLAGALVALPVRIGGGK
jgi:hypothetical protein